MSSDIPAEQSIYNRLGGEQVMDSLTMAFYANVIADERVSHYFKHIDVMQQIQHQKKFLTLAFGGPNIYGGRTLKQAHKGLNISEADFAAIAEILANTMFELEVNPILVDEIMVIVGSTKDDIVA